MEAIMSFDRAPQIVTIADAEEIVKYEPAKTISYAKLIDDRVYFSEQSVKVAHIGTVQGEPAWADGFMLEVSEVPDKLKALKKYREAKGEDKPRNFDHLIPELGSDAITIKPLATILRAYLHSDVVYLADTHAEIAVQKKYIDYFLIRYGAPFFVVKGPTKAFQQTPLVVKHVSKFHEGGRVIGVIMPIQMAREVMEKCWLFVRGTPVPQETVKPSLTDLESFYPRKELERMARNAGISPSGKSKRELCRELVNKGVLK